MARKAKKPRKIPEVSQNSREGLTRKAAQDGVSPVLSKSKDTLSIQTSSGRIILESKGVLTKLGSVFFLSLIHI